FYTYFSFDCYPHLHDLHSFPTRRSSDLGWKAIRKATRKNVAGDGNCRREHGTGKSTALHGLQSRGKVRNSERWVGCEAQRARCRDRKSTRLNSSHLGISYAVFCLKKKKK